MTTVRIELGRFPTTVEEVADWIERAPGTRPNRLDVEIDPKAHAYIPIAELQRALEVRGISVELVPWPEPPPLPWWRRVRYWPRRAYYWGRRVVLGETVFEQWARDMYGNGDAIHDLTTRDSPLLRTVKRDATRRD